jgi:hypothetical protein
MRVASLLVLAAAALGHPVVALSQSAPAGDKIKTIGVPSSQKRVEALIVLNSRGAKLNGQTLVLEGASPSAILFADRPVRSAGHILTKEVVELWSSGSFAKDPPNATVSAFSRDGSAVKDAVVVLKKPKLEGENLTFDVDLLEGALESADGPASIFIDTIWFGIGSGGVTYLGRNATTGGTSPAIGSRYDTSTFSGWSNPAPNEPQQRRAPPNYGLTAPPDMMSGPYKQCGAPPLLPCY